MYKSQEDSWPDLNLYDYAMGFEVLDFDGRYLRLPLYAMRSSWAPALTKHTVPDEELLAKKKDAYEDYKRLRKENQELQAVKSNVDTLLRIEEEQQEKKLEQHR